MYMSFLPIGTNVSQSASPSKLNFQFDDGLTILYWKCHNSSIQSTIEVNEHLMESLFDKLSNRSSPTLISCRQGLQIIKIFYRCFCQGLHRRHGLVIHPWDPGLSESTPQGDGELTKKALGHPTPWPPP
jgi:hypothetical protein